MHDESMARSKNRIQQKTLPPTIARHASTYSRSSSVVSRRRLREIWKGLLLFFFSPRWRETALAVMYRTAHSLMRSLHKHAQHPPEWRSRWLSPACHLQAAAGTPHHRRLRRRFVPGSSQGGRRSADSTPPDAIQTQILLRAWTEVLVFCLFGNNVTARAP